MWNWTLIRFYLLYLLRASVLTKRSQSRRLIYKSFIWQIEKLYKSHLTCNLNRAFCKSSVFKLHLHNHCREIPKFAFCWLWRVTIAYYFFSKISSQVSFDTFSSVFFTTNLLLFVSNFFMIQSKLIKISFSHIYETAIWTSREIITSSLIVSCCVSNDYFLCFSFFALSHCASRFLCVSKSAGGGEKTNKNTTCNFCQFLLFFLWVRNEEEKKYHKKSLLWWIVQIGLAIDCETSICEYFTFHWRFSLDPKEESTKKNRNRRKEAPKNRI